MENVPNEQTDLSSTPETGAAQVITEPQNGNKKKSSNLVVTGLIVAILLVIIGVSAGTVYGVYRASENPAIVALADFFRVPVAKVNGTKILYSEYVRDLHSLQTFYAKKPEASPASKEEESDQVLSRLIGNALVAQTAKEYNVAVTEADRELAKKDILARFENDEKKFAADVLENLGVSSEEFFTRILEPTLLEKKVSEQFASNSDPKLSAFSEDQVRASHILFLSSEAADLAKAKAEATKVLRQIQNGADFAELAKKHGTDGTKEQGGDLGWFGRGDMVKEFEDAVYALQKGELAKTPVKTQFGYHIIKLTDRRDAKNFGAYMNEKLKTAKIEIFGKVHNPFANLQGGAAVTTN